MESRGRVHEDRGDFTENIESVFMRARSDKSGEEQGLTGAWREEAANPSPTRGGKSSREKRGGTSSRGGPHRQVKCYHPMRTPEEAQRPEEE